MVDLNTDICTDAISPHFILVKILKHREMPHQFEFLRKYQRNIFGDFCWILWNSATLKNIFCSTFENCLFERILSTILIYQEYQAVHNLSRISTCPYCWPVRWCFRPLVLFDNRQPRYDLEKNDPHSFLWQLTITSNSQSLRRRPSLSWESPIGAEHWTLYVNYAIAMRQRRSQTIILHQNCILVHHLISLCWIVWTIR